ncbi:MAG TPA: ABC transporter substrate-binding protein [Stellaceae bacterium]|jgi:peptide/nickel transport system substrate-binding protein|nr:ABC transporter substrate-binding protein [Stellaceae bacterium]
MTRTLCAFATAGALLLAISPSASAIAQQSGGILRVGHFDSPASMSMLEESTVAVNRPMMGVFNNLVMFPQDEPQNTLDAIIPELATGWTWSEDGTELTMPLHHGVKWHDGKPFTAADVKCTFDLLQGKATDKLRINPRKSWYDNLVEITTKGDNEVTFHLKRPQPSFLAMLATGWSPMYPCHVSPAQMRQHPIGTGPFKFVDFKPNQSITLTRNTDYWKPGRPYLDGIEYTIIKDVSTRLLSFIAGKQDVYFGVTMPQLKDVKNQLPQAICDMTITNVSRNLLVNRDVPPFDNPELRRAMTLALDRQAFVDIIADGQGTIGGVMQPPPEGVWGMPTYMLKPLPGYDPDVATRRAAARKIMQKLGYGPDKHLSTTVSTRNVAPYRDPAVILISQLKEIYIDADLKPIDTAQWYPTLTRKDYKIGLNVTETAVDDPDPTFYENYVCGALRNYTGYCNRDVDKLVDQQSAETDVHKRKKLVWQIERKLMDDDARPILFYTRGANCRAPQLKGLTTMVNSIYNGSRFEDLWLEQGGYGSSSAPSTTVGAR